MAGVYRSRRAFSIWSRLFLAGLLLVVGAEQFQLLRSQSVETEFRFDRYHTVEEFQAHLEALASLHPQLTQLLQIGRSRLGRPILAMEINNPATGPGREKPGFYLDGNIHGGEVLGGEAALFFVHHLLERYGEDPEIRSLVDSTSFYVVPLVNPDGRAISVDTPENHRWNVRPTDEDGDGLVDEDPPEDLDGDGRILRMRLPHPEGGWRIHAQDPRRMVRAGRSEGGATAYAYYTEGIDNDGDGRFNEDRVGGVDLNRNFPANWHPGQFASGPFPLSEPETRALVEYITSRPQIAAIHTYHTSGGLILRFPTLADQDWDYPRADLEDYRVIAEEGIRFTGYDNYAYQKQAIVDLMSPGHGVFNDWGSKIFGVLAITTEMWKHALGQGEEALFQWNQEVLQSQGFIDWYPYRHPQLGEVELGGWDRWSTSSPPHHLVLPELEKNTQWVISFARRLPRVEILSLEAHPGQRDGSFRVEARIANTGWMPTATAYARDVLEIAEPVRAHLMPGQARLVTGDLNLNLGTIPGMRGDPSKLQTLHWDVEIPPSVESVTLTLTLASEKAGTVRRTLQVTSNR